MAVQDSTNKITVAQLYSVVTSFASKIAAKFVDKNDVGTVAALDEVAEANLASALATKINGKADTADLGSLAAKSEVAKTDLATALSSELDGKADTADLGDVAALDEIAEANLASALATKINAKADASDVATATAVATAQDITDIIDAIYPAEQTP